MTLMLDVDVEEESYTRLILLEATKLPRDRGRRWWFRCPACGRRCLHIYPTQGLVCRQCARLKYAAQYRLKDILRTA